ncbi:MAG: hypothetical protein IKT99_02150 [Oscillospiraceae bacterium]|nr:hypothetical protein [Oscillospiraceae bacterium]
MKKNKLPMILLALGAAILVWLYDVTVVNPNDTSTISGIPVRFINEDELNARDLMITSGAGGTVSLRVSGRRSELKELSKDNLDVVVDLSQITEAGRHELAYTVRYPATVSSSDLKIDVRSPVTVSVEVEHYIRRAVEVRTVFEGEAAEEDDTLVIDHSAMELQPAEIMVTGPAELVESVECARVIIPKADITQTTVADYDYDLLDQNGEVIDRDELVTDAEKVNISIPVHKTKQIPLTVSFLPGGGATEKDLTCTIQPASITISGEPALVDEIEEIELDPVNLAAVTTQPGNLTRQIVLPEGINNASGVAEASVVLWFKGLSVTSVSIEDYTIVNTPEGLTATPLSESVQVNLRGTDADLRKLEQRLEEIAVTVDLSGYSQGTFIVPVKVELPEDLQVGALGNNTITVTLS